MTKTRILASIALVTALACAGLAGTGNAVIVGERWEEPDTPRLAVLLGGQWTDGRRVNPDALRLRCTYFTGSSLVRRIHIVDHDRREGVFSCASFIRSDPSKA